MTYRAGIIETGGVAGMRILGIQDADEIGSMMPALYVIPCGG
jgi:hypothetical protein